MAKRSTFGNVFRRKRRGWRLLKGEARYFPGFYCRVRVGKREVTRWAGPDRETAAEFAATLLRKSSREALLGEKVVPVVTVAELLPQVEAQRTQRYGAEAVATEAGRFRRVAEVLGPRPVASLTAADVDALVDATLAKGLSPASANRTKDALSVVLGFAVAAGYVGHNVARGVRRRKEDVRAVPFVRSEDIDAIVAAASDAPYRVFLRVLADTGLRCSEGVRLAWRDVDLRRAVLVVRKSKTHKPREVPLTRGAVAALDGLRSARTIPMAGEDPVWPAYRDLGSGALSHRFTKTAIRAGLPSLRGVHSLRHGFCSRLAQAGVPMVTIAELAGHSSIAMTQRYARHLPQGATVEAIRRLEAPIPASAGDAKGDAGRSAAASR